MKRRLLAQWHERSGDEGGFTLVEILIAMFILLTIMGPLVASVLIGFNTTKSSTSVLKNSTDRQLTALYLTRDVANAATVTAPATWASTCYGSTAANPTVTVTGVATLKSSTVTVTTGVVGASFLGAAVTDNKGAFAAATTVTAIGVGGTSFTISSPAIASKVADSITLSSGTVPVMATWKVLNYAGSPPTTTASATAAREVDYVLKTQASVASGQITTRWLWRYTYNGSFATSNCSAATSQKVLAYNLQASAVGASGTVSGQSVKVTLVDAGGYKLYVNGTRRI